MMEQHIVSFFCARLTGWCFLQLMFSVQYYALHRLDGVKKDFTVSFVMGKFYFHILQH